MARSSGRRTDGRLLVGVLADGSPTVLVADPATGRFTRLGAPDTDTIVASWSPDGRRLASVAERRFANDCGISTSRPQTAPTRAPSRSSSRRASGCRVRLRVGWPCRWVSLSPGLPTDAGSS